MVRLEQMEDGKYVLELCIENSAMKIQRKYVFEDVTDSVDADSLKPLEKGEYYLIK